MPKNVRAVSLRVASTGLVVGLGLAGGAQDRGVVGAGGVLSEVGAGSLPLSGHAGTNKVVFQGRLSRTRSLAPGMFEVVVNGRDARGVQAVSRPLSFTIATH